MKKVCSIVLALLLALTTAVPGYAAEGDVLPDLEQEETAPVQPSEDETEADEVPDLPDDPEEPGEELPVEPEDPEAPPEEDNPEVPGDEEPSDENDPDEGSPDEDDPDSVPDEDAEDEAGEEEEEDEDDLFIDVLVPASGQVIVNPYQMSVDTSTGEVTDQIVQEPQMLESFTECPLQVSVQVLGSLQPWSNARFVSDPPADDALDKEIFMYAEFQSEPDQWSYTYEDWFNQVLVTDWRSEKEDVMTLDAYGIGYFRLFGAMTPFPADMWTKDDVMTVTLAFTFTPAESLPAFANLPETDPDAVPEQVFEPIPEEDASPAEEPLPEEPDFEEPLPDEAFSDGGDVPDAGQSEDAADSTAE